MNKHIESLINFDIRHTMFQRAMRFVDYEMVEGDIVEFGVYSGRSAALLSYYHQSFKETVHGRKYTPARKVIGLDRFEGMPANDHPRFGTGTFRTNETWHPLFGPGDVITPAMVADIFFPTCNLPTPEIIKGFYNSPEVKERFDKECQKVAVVHIDCDLTESTLQALNLVQDKLQDGTILLFDDWFNYKGSSEKGEQAAFFDWIVKTQTEKTVPFGLREYHPYATFGMSFIVSKHNFTDK